MEYAHRIAHPRSGVSAWHWEPKDIRPEEGEYWRCWIQFKFQSSEFDLEKLDKLSREADRVVTKEILKQCLHGKSN